MTIDLEGAIRLYEETTALLKKVFTQAEKDEPIDGREIAEVVWRLVEHMTLGDRGLIYFTNRSTPRNYVIAQSVNVCILSLLVGIGLGYDTSQLHELGAAALLHDIGITHYLHLAAQPRKLSEEELENIRKHPIQGVAILKKIPGLSESALFVCREYRKRKWDKSPASVEERTLREYAQIVGILDIYVAMIQPRPYRDAKLSHEAIQELIGEDLEIFDTRVMKTLINLIGIYPIGSWVKLNTEEIARVIEQHPDFPLHPSVEILFDPQGNFLEIPRTYDLFKQRVVYIKEPVDFRRLQLSHRS